MPQPVQQREPARPAPRWVQPLCAFIIAGNMLWFGQDAFRAVFNGDDMMNMYGYWEKGPWRVLLSQVLFFSSSYRPMGAAFYMPLYQFAGLRPLPYHLAAFALMAINVWLAYRVTWRLSGSRAAALTAFLASYHVGMAELYYQTGVIYDILCFLFYFWALDYYLAFRERGEAAGKRRLFMLAAIYACALNSKEMAVTLPVVLLAYEWFFHPPAGWRPCTVLRWAAEVPAVWITALMTAAFVYGKTHGPTAIANLPSYQGVYSAAQFVEANRAYLVQHFLGQVKFTAAGVFLLWGAMLAIALLLKRRDLRLLWVWAVVTPLPVIFVQRAHSCVYIPFTGLAMFIAIALMLAAGAAARLMRLRPAILQAAAGIALAALFARENAFQKSHYIQKYIDEDGQATWSMIRRFDALRPKVAPHSKVLLLNYPLPNWDLHFVAALWLRDRTVEIWVDRPEHRLPESDLHRYQQVFRFEPDRLLQVKPPSAG